MMKQAKNLQTGVLKSLNVKLIDKKSYPYISKSTGHGKKREAHISYMRTLFPQYYRNDISCQEETKGCTINLKSVVYDFIL